MIYAISIIYSNQHQPKEQKKSQFYYTKEYSKEIGFDWILGSYPW